MSGTPRKWPMAFTTRRARPSPHRVLGVASPKHPRSHSRISRDFSMSESDLSWWERQGNFVGYPELGQGQLPHCVYASISGAINHLVNRDVWTPLDLLNECRRRGHVAANFGAVDPALDRISDEVEKHHHNKD